MLDLNEAVRLCLEHGLCDALLYVYNRGLQDYVTPLQELLLQLRKRMREEGELDGEQEGVEEEELAEWGRGLGVVGGRGGEGRRGLRWAWEEGTVWCVYMLPQITSAQWATSSWCT